MKYPTFRTTMQTLSTDVDLLLLASELNDNMISTVSSYGREIIHLSPEAGYMIYETKVVNKQGLGEPDDNSAAMTQMIFFIINEDWYQKHVVNGSSQDNANKYWQALSYDFIKSTQGTAFNLDMISVKISYPMERGLNPRIDVEILSNYYSYQSLMDMVFRRLLKCDPIDVDHLNKSLNGMIPIPALGLNRLSVYTALGVAKGRENLMAHDTGRY